MYRIGKKKRVFLLTEILKPFIDTVINRVI